MSEDRTQDYDGRRSFEERVFARFDAIDARLNDVDTRLQKLEARQYDTKPIWENALTEIKELRAEMNERFDDVEGKIDVLSRDMLQLRSDQGRLQRRVDEIESPRA